eukprot:TRINITY_DN93775_c0_g1_i1.p1 TRINITY_DN93775_c0_g1~~TRINITY_DN93775_c0_g1_i1.p1  ORF type:complete len:243 (-),score=26.65 TRINITY_DN93775_c0_g1_i1:125-853(-)
MPKRTVLFGSPWALQPFPRRDGSSRRPRQQEIGRQSPALQMPHQPKPARLGMTPRGGARMPGVRGPRRAKWSPQQFVAPSGPLSPIREEDSSNSQCSPPCKRRRTTQKDTSDKVKPIAASTAEMAVPSFAVADRPSISSAGGLPQSSLGLTSRTSSPSPAWSTTGKACHKRCYPQDGSTPPRRRLQNDSFAAPATQADSLATPPRGSSSLLRRHRQRQSQEQCYSTLRPSGGIKDRTKADSV